MPPQRAMFQSAINSTVPRGTFTTTDFAGHQPPLWAKCSVVSRCFLSFFLPPFLPPLPPFFLSSDLSSKVCTHASLMRLRSPRKQTHFTIPPESEKGAQFWVDTEKSAGQASRSPLSASTPSQPAGRPAPGAPPVGALGAGARGARARGRGGGRARDPMRCGSVAGGVCVLCTSLPTLPAGGDGAK